MPGRKKVRGGRGRPTSDVGKMLQDYFQPTLHNLVFTSLAVGSDIKITLVDNSADFGNAILKWSKLTIRPFWDAPDNTDVGLGTLVVGVIKEDQDDAGSAYSLDVEETVREMRNDGKIMRGPWWYSGPSMVTSGFLPAYWNHMKPIVLKNFVMDREEDLSMNFTNVGSGARSGNAHSMNFALKGFVWVIK